MTALACVVALASGPAALGQGGQAQPERDPEVSSAKPTRYIFGARDCAACHDQDNHATYTEEERDGKICRMNEFAIFDKQDKHKLAYSALTGLRGKEMNKLLGTLDGCVNCHGMPDRSVKNEEYTRETDGVTCVACHGQYSNWVQKHPATADDEWRKLNRKEKEAHYGMTDLWDPVRRVETCASCHVGSRAEGKVISHAMYAAGHPPLPSFEAATFGDAQPPHWEKLSQKSPERRNRLKPAPDPKNLEQTQLVAAGGLVVLRESMRLLADHAAASKADPVGAAWLDFARFDCYACHHELPARDGASWRQVRRRDGHPGRPIEPDWPLILVQLGIEAANPLQAPLQEAQLKQHLAELHESMRVRPFGDPEGVDLAVQKIAAWADPLLKSRNLTTLDAAGARRMLELLCALARQNIPEYDSARQIAWAFRVIYRESLPKEKRDAVVQHVLDDLDAVLALDLPSAKVQVPIEKTLRDRLRIIAEFDPESFQAQFAIIAKRLARPSDAPPGGR